MSLNIMNPNGSFTQVAGNGGSIPGAKLYGDTGQNTDGAMTQKATTDALENAGRGSIINVITTEEYLFGGTVAISDGTSTVTGTISQTGKATIGGVLLIGDLTVTVSKGTATTTTLLNVPYFSVYDVYAVQFVKGWTASAGYAEGTYTTLDEIFADEKAVRKLMTIHDSVDYLVANCFRAEVQTIIKNDICAKWINLRDYALDALYANETIKDLMDEADKYFYGEWVYDSENETWGPKGNVPIMTSDTTPYGSVIKSGEYGSNYHIYYAFDNNSSTNAVTQQSTGNQYIGYSFVNPICVKKVYIVIDNNFSRWTTCTLQGSNDGTTYTDIYTFNQNDLIGEKYFNIDNTDYYLYYRLYYYVNTSGNRNVTTLQFYGRELKVSVPKMTSNTAPYGEAFGNRSDPYKAFDKSVTSGYNHASDAVGTIVGYNFANTCKILMALSYRIDDTNTHTTKYTFKFQASNDGDNWYDVSDLITDGGSSIKTYSINTSSAWKSYRIIISGTSSSAVLNIVGLNFYGLDYSEYDWDEDNPRHYLYDHGVEFEELTVDGYTVSGWTLTEPQKESNQLYFPATGSTSSGNLYGLATPIDLSDYDLVRAKVGDKLVISNSAYGFVMVGTTKTATSSASAAYTSVGTSSDLPYNIYVDVSSLNTDEYININSGYSTRAFTVTEWWLE